MTILDNELEQYKAHKDAVLTLAYNKGVQSLIFADELRRLCKLMGYNLPGLFAQAWHETGGFKGLWPTHRNPAGIKNLSGNKYQRWYNGVDAARAFVVHMAAYVPPPRSGYALDHYWYLDNRYEHAKQANTGRMYRTMDDLSGRWAEDPMYGRFILKTYQELYGVD